MNTYKVTFQSTIRPYHLRVVKSDVSSIKYYKQIIKNVTNLVRGNIYVIFYDVFDSNRARTLLYV